MILSRALNAPKKIDSGVDLLKKKKRSDSERFNGIGSGSYYTNNLKGSGSESNSKKNRARFKGQVHQKKAVRNG